MLGSLWSHPDPPLPCVAQCRCETTSNLSAAQLCGVSYDSITVIGCIQHTLTNHSKLQFFASAGLSHRIQLKSSLSGLYMKTTQQGAGHTQTVTNAAQSCCSRGAMERIAVARLTKEYSKIRRDPIDGMVVCPNESNLREWHYLLAGCKDSSYRGGAQHSPASAKSWSLLCADDTARVAGVYHGKLVFPKEYPHRPPSIYMITPRWACAAGPCSCVSSSRLFFSDNRLPHLQWTIRGQ